MKPDLDSMDMRRPYAAKSDRRESLPFRVHLVTNPQDVRKAVDIRASAFGRHYPKVGEAMRNAETEDFRSDVLLLLAERKLDGVAVGSMRLQPNFHQRLHIEAETSLPETLNGLRLLETARLGVASGEAGGLVMAALVKATYEICHALQIDVALALARRSMAEVFRSMSYDFLKGPFHIPSAIQPFWLMAMPTIEFEKRLRLSGHRYYNFIARTEHPDIQIDFSRVRATLDRPEI